MWGLERRGGVEEGRTGIASDWPDLLKRNAIQRVFESAAYAVERNDRKRRKYRDTRMHPFSASGCKKWSLNVFDSVSLQYSDPVSQHCCCCYHSRDFYSALQSWNPFLAVSIISLSLLQSLAKASLHLTNWLIKALVADERTWAARNAAFSDPTTWILWDLINFWHQK